MHATTQRSPIVNPDDAYILGGLGEALDALAEEARRMGAVRVIRLVGGSSPRWPQVPILTFPPVAWKTSGRCRVSAYGWAALLSDRRRMRLISDVRLSTLSASDGQATK